MVIEHLSSTRASRARRPRNTWPVIITIMVIIGAVGGRIIVQR